MSFAWWCIVIGSVAWLGSYMLTDLFVNVSDANNPMRTLTRAVGYGGIAIGVYGVVLLLVQAL